MVTDTRPFHNAFNTFEYVSEGLTRAITFQKRKQGDYFMVPKLSYGGGLYFRLKIDINENIDFPYGATHCCGCRILSHLNGGFAEEIPLERQYQEFVSTLWNQFGACYAYYFVLSSEQLKNHNSELSLIRFFMETGAKCLDTRPNRYHAPNDISMFVWDGSTNNPKLTSLVDSNNYYYEPKWWGELDDHEYAKFMSQHHGLIDDRKEYFKHQEELRNQEKDRRTNEACLQAFYDVEKLETLLRNWSKSGSTRSYLSKTIQKLPKLLKQYFGDLGYDE